MSDDLSHDDERILKCTLYLYGLTNEEFTFGSFIEYVMKHPYPLGTVWVLRKIVNWSDERIDSLFSRLRGELRP
jgi:hypothetical protein